jgi:outer membrane immunogenic protein
MRGFLVAAVMLGAVSAAQAADMPILRGGFSDGYSRGPVSWQGIYVGGQGSWGSQKSAVPGVGDLQGTFITPALVAPYLFGTPPSTANSLNGGYGAFFGYNSQFEDVVVSIEGNYIHDGFSATTSALRVNPATPALLQSVTYSTATMKLSDFGSLRLRAGYMMGCFLPYLFVGAGFGDQTVVRAVSASPPPLAPAWMTDSKSKLIYGYTAGIGFDVQLVGGLFGRFEYEYKRVTSNLESIVNTARVGLGYKF